MDSASKSKLRKMAELTISCYSYEIHYDDISDTEVYQKKVQMYKKRPLKIRIYIAIVNNQPRGILHFEVFANNYINMPS